MCRTPANDGSTMTTAAVCGLSPLHWLCRCGFWLSQAYEYVLYNGGIDTEAAYPYVGVNGECHFSKSGVGAKVAGVVNVTQVRTGDGPENPCNPFKPQKT